MLAALSTASMSSPLGSGPKTASNRFMVEVETTVCDQATGCLSASSPAENLLYAAGRKKS